MTDVEPVVSDFAATGRTGRRNALPDILGSTAGRGADDLPNKLAELSVGGMLVIISQSDRLVTEWLQKVWHN